MSPGLPGVTWPCPHSPTRSGGLDLLHLIGEQTDSGPGGAGLVTDWSDGEEGNVDADDSDGYKE